MLDISDGFNERLYEVSFSRHHPGYEHALADDHSDMANSGIELTSVRKADAYHILTGTNEMKIVLIYF